MDGSCTRRAGEGVLEEDGLQTQKSSANELNKERGWEVTESGHKIQSLNAIS